MVIFFVFVIGFEVFLEEIDIVFGYFVDIVEVILNFVGGFFNVIFIVDVMIDVEGGWW